MVPALKVQGLSKVYDNGFQALKGIDLSVEQGDFFALLGPNGAGKSTTLGILSGLVQKTAGLAEVMGFDVNKQSFGARLNLGVVPQEFNFNQFEKVEDVVVTQAGYFGLSRREARTSAEYLLKELDLWDKRDEPSRMLSGGMKRRLMIARALVHKPKVLILDEPTAGVDIELRRSMWTFMKALNEAGTTIILTTHYLEEAEQLCRNIAIINRGEIVRCTSVRALLANMKSETFVFDLMSQAPADLQLAGWVVRVVGEDTIEVVVKEGQSINSVFEALSAKGCLVRSMRPKSNRLEELFVDLVQGDNQ
ncbi:MULTISPECIES: ABC transporter ATP-binding protein [unclassified Oceanobacter]|uniref:ABC transporter ATP-binding protein n=1 Tax=unclassified Oceanobacter TaxID=2620260 RepID=UPI0026E317FA|nr:MULTISPECIES: ABC transporter ATP-binding protein [unclassified Oceanobacter]MDO6683787.1 ABC transporter ATP-binding protein [Oceanobacter sp. 5_MG-2023]MDP2504141.1 ABC transporter ATP-binding protein [Oceanobacter sp. 3_MG-2023]MDP2546580.1 ABC transporter ATP-binding protein [Oceanobacter sp. 4_MG-2023]MDP2610186.1 ABC transporter ATP-binding protein [Oceanobacter sp. 1_MG-2023]MDP2613452.1 ABC transporter ATP-binding protein [Oceanobacter sp. 2_MG-2023]